MPPQHKPVGENRFRETSGLYFEDFEPGTVYEHRPGRTITESDNTWFTLLTMNSLPLHFDAAYSARTGWNRPLVNSTLVLAILTGMSVRTISQKAVANLGWDRVKCLQPVFNGDTLYAETRILSKRDSSSRAGQGIVTVETRGLNQDGVVIMTFERIILIYKKGQSPEEAANY